MIENGRTRLVPVQVGQRNAAEAEVIQGLEVNAEVILHPANDLKNGARVALRGE